MKTVDTELAVPMHFGEDFSIFSSLQTDSCADGYRGKIAFFTERGAQIQYN